MEQELNRIKLVLVEKKKTGKWQPQELGVSECTMSRWTSNKAQPNLSFMPLQNCLVSKSKICKEAKPSSSPNQDVKVMYIWIKANFYYIKLLTAIHR